MALPTLAKTWLFNYNPGSVVSSLNGLISTSGSPLTDHQNVLFTIKNMLVNMSDGAGSFPTNRWVVKGSCNGAGGFGNNDNVDRWITAANVVRNNSSSPAAHSWIIIEQAGIATKFQVCLDYNGDSNQGNPDRLMSIRFSPGAGYFSANGGTDGTATQAPTASDEIILLGSAANTISTRGFFGNNNGVSFTARLNAMQSTDGAVTRVIGLISGVTVFYMEFGKIQNPVAGLTKPHYGIVRAGQSVADVLTYTHLWSTASETAGVSAIRTVGAPGTQVNFFMTSEGFGGVNLGSGISTPNDFDLSWPFAPVGLAVQTSPGRGRHGTIFDLWYGSSGVPTGDDYPDTGTLHQFVQLGNLIVPWNSSSVPLIA